MGIEFIISNNTIVLGQRKEQSKALSRPRGPAGRGGRRSGRAALLGPARRRALGRPGPNRGSTGPGVGARARGEAAGPVTPPAEGARGGDGVALWFDLFFASPFATMPRGRPWGLGVYSLPSWPPAAKQSLDPGRADHKGRPAPLAQREGLLTSGSHRSTPAPRARYPLY